MKNFSSCFRRGPGGGKPANRRSPLGLYPGEPTPRLDDRVVEVPRTRRGPVLRGEAGSKKGCSARLAVQPCGTSTATRIGGSGWGRFSGWLLEA